MISKKHIVLTISITFILMLIGCSSRTNNTKKYPKNVTVNYKIISSALAVKGDIMYINEKGGLSKLENITLPFFQSFSREVKFGELLRLSGVFAKTTDVTMTITVDDKIVQDQTFNSDSDNTGVVMYQFK